MIAKVESDIPGEAKPHDAIPDRRPNLYVVGYILLPLLNVLTSARPLQGIVHA